MTELLTANMAAPALAWALAHSLWQGALAAALTAVTAVVLRRRAPGVRYLVACAALAAMALSFAATTVFYARQALPSPTLQADSRADTAAATQGSQRALDLRLSSVEIER